MLDDEELELVLWLRECDICVSWSVAVSRSGSRGSRSFVLMLGQIRCYRLCIAADQTSPGFRLCRLPFTR